MPDYYRKVQALMSTLSLPERDAMVASIKVLAAHLDVMR